MRKAHSQLDRNKKNSCNAVLYQAMGSNRRCNLCCFMLHLRVARSREFVIYTHIYAMHLRFRVGAAFLRRTWR